ncbi:hypothetical protein GCM10010182_20340 [Actinomadura cremea]|nr:hypothetical protein GCM10010182_20340 [Actinomadura cremea]
MCRSRPFSSTLAVLSPSTFRNGSSRFATPSFLAHPGDGIQASRTGGPAFAQADSLNAGAVGYSDPCASSGRSLVSADDVRFAPYGDGRRSG